MIKNQNVLTNKAKKIKMSYLIKLTLNSQYYEWMESRLIRLAQMQFAIVMMSMVASSVSALLCFFVAFVYYLIHLLTMYE